MNSARTSIAVICLTLLATCAPPAPQEPITAVAPGTIVAPAANVPAAWAAYSGVWLGKWDGVWDAAIIVRKIHQDGLVDVTYRWANDVGGPWRTDSTTLGRIENGVLIIGGHVRLAIDPANPTVARGDFFHGTNDAHRVSRFNKVI